MQLPDCTTFLPHRSPMIEPLQTSLQSFVNSYKAVMWRLRECSLNDEQLAAAIGVSSSVIRSRRAKPDLWKLSDINRLSSYFTMPTTACSHLDQLLKELPQQWMTLPMRERRRYERLLPVKKSQFHAYNLSDWPVHHLLKMHQNLILNDELAS